MTESFAPPPREHHSPTYRSSNFDAELRSLELRTERVRAAGRAAFADGNDSYDVATVVILRLAALLERQDVAQLDAVLTAEEAAAIRTTRNIAAHAGYKSMNDDLFWLAVTERIPDILRRLRAHGRERPTDDCWP
ncbi:MAG: antitoxin [Propionibacteriaceae bacterium]|nr:antitoxin [Propionibacteriaceae bacterium]